MIQNCLFRGFRVLHEGSNDQQQAPQNKPDNSGDGGIKHTPSNHILRVVGEEAGDHQDAIRNHSSDNAHEKSDCTDGSECAENVMVPEAGRSPYRNQTEKDTADAHHRQCTDRFVSIR